MSTSFPICNIKVGQRSLSVLVDRASAALAAARTSAEILEARDMAGFAYDMAKRAARMAAAKGAHDALIAAAHRAQADALEIEAGAKRRLADEYDAAQERGEVAKHGQRQDLSDGKVLPTVADIGLSYGQIHDARLVRDALAADPGIIRRVLDEALVRGDEPSKAIVRHALLATKAIYEKRAAAKRAANNTLRLSPAPHPPGKFSTLVIDPPWPAVGWMRLVRPNQTGLDYPTMSEDELLAFGETVAKLAADDAHLFVWTTQRFLPFTHKLIEAWDARYGWTMVWLKPGGFQPIGQPQFNVEFVVYGRIGSPSFVDTKAFNCGFAAPRREHSRKPDEFYDTIRRVTDGPRIDVFSREAREGFAQYGNEVGKFAEAAP